MKIWVFCGGLGIDGDSDSVTLLYTYNDFADKNSQRKSKLSEYSDNSNPAQNKLSTMLSTGYPQEGICYIKIVINGCKVQVFYKASYGHTFRTFGLEEEGVTFDPFIQTIQKIHP